MIFRPPGQLSHKNIHDSLINIMNCTMNKKKTEIFLHASTTNGYSLDSANVAREFRGRLSSTGTRFFAPAITSFVRRKTSDAMASGFIIADVAICTGALCIGGPLCRNNGLTTGPALRRRHRYLIRPWRACTRPQREYLTTRRYSRHWLMVTFVPA